MKTMQQETVGKRPVFEGAMFALIAILKIASVRDVGSEISAIPWVSVAVYALFAVILFINKRDIILLAPITILGFFALSEISSLFRVDFLYRFGVDGFWMVATILIRPLMYISFFVATFLNLKGKASKLYILTCVFAVIFALVSIQTSFMNTLVAIAIIFTSIWVANPTLGFSSMYKKGGLWSILSIGLVIGIFLGIFFAVFVKTEYNYTWAYNLLVWLSPIFSMFSALNQGRKNAKATKMILNQTVANSGTIFAAQAKKELAAEQAKQDRNAVIKGAVVGSIVAGQTGAIVGAVAAKAEIDSKNNAESANSRTPLAAQAKQDRNAVIKGAVVGGIIGGDVGAVVGAVAAKTSNDTKNSVAQ